MKLDEFKPERKRLTNKERAYLAENGYKYCYVCKRARPLTEFNKDASQPGGYNRFCRPHQTIKTKKNKENAKKEKVFRKKADMTDFVFRSNNLDIQKAVEYKKELFDRLKKKNRQTSQI